MSTTKAKQLTQAEKNTLIARGLDASLFEVLSSEELRTLLKESETQALTMRVQKQRENICTELVNTFNNAKEVKLTKDELAERVRILNQTSFFEVRKDGQPFTLTNSAHAKAFMLLPNYVFSNKLSNKQIEACTTEKDKVMVAVGKWLARGRAITNSEIIKPGHSKYFNGYKDLPYTMKVEGNNVIFTRK